jgi:hypothetical protein
VPGTNEYLTAFAYIYATLNKYEDNYGAVLNYLSGGRQSAGTQTFDLNAPPSVNQIHSFLGSLRAWDPTRGNGKYSNLRDRLDPVLADILAHPTGTGGLRYLVTPEEPFFSIFGSSYTFGGDGGNPFKIAYNDLSEDALIFRDYGFDPDDVEGYLTSDLVVKYGSNGSIESIELREQEQTRQLNMAQASLVEEQLRAFLEAANPRLPYDPSVVLLDDWVTGGSSAPTVQESFLTAYIDENGTSPSRATPISCSASIRARAVAVPWSIPSTIRASGVAGLGVRPRRQSGDGGHEADARRRAGDHSEARAADHDTPGGFADRPRFRRCRRHDRLGPRRLPHRRQCHRPDDHLGRTADDRLQLRDILNTLAFDSGVATTRTWATPSKDWTRSFSPTSNPRESARLAPSSPPSWSVPWG